MKKLIWIILAIVFIAGVAFANDETAIQEYTYTLNNNSATPYMHTVATTVIRPKYDKIIGYEVVQYPSVASSSERIIAVYDSSTLTNANSELIGEKETSIGSAGEMYTRPRKIQNGVRFYQGAYTTAIIHFVKE